MSLISMDVPNEELLNTYNLFHSLKLTYSSDPERYNEFYSSLISSAVYEFNYTELGTLLAEMFPLWEDSELFSDPIEGLDGHNGFEEFVCHVLEHQFRAYGVIDDAGFHVDKLNTLWQAFLVYRDPKQFKAIRDSLLQDA